jgi:hypothetical protein
MKKIIIVFLFLLLLTSFVFARDIEINRNFNIIHSCNDYCRNNIYYYDGDYNYTENICRYKTLFCDLGCDLNTNSCKSQPTISYNVTSDYNYSSINSLIDLNRGLNNDIYINDDINATVNYDYVDDIINNREINSINYNNNLNVEYSTDVNCNTIDNNCINITNIYYVNDTPKLTDENQSLIVNLKNKSQLLERYIGEKDILESINFYIEDNVPMYAITILEEKKLLGIITTYKEKIIKVNAVEQSETETKKIGSVCVTDNDCPEGYKCESISLIDAPDLKRCNGNYIKNNIYTKECSGQGDCDLDCSVFEGPCEEKVGLSCYVSYGAKSKALCLSNYHASGEKEILEKKLLEIPDYFCKSLPTTWDKEWPENKTYQSYKEKNYLYFTCARVISVELKCPTSSQCICEGELCTLIVPGSCYPKFRYNYYTGEFDYISGDVECYFSWDTPKTVSVLGYEKSISNYQDLYKETIKNYNSRKMFWYYWEQ